MRLSRLIVLLAAIFALLASCERPARDYSRWQNIPANGWAYTDTVSLLPVDTALTDNDSIVSGRVKVALRHSNDYPYSNIRLELTYHRGDGLMARDTINLRLADLYGRWLGTGFGAGYQQEITVNPSTPVDLTRPMSLRHIVRDDTLKGVEQVGILVETAR